MTERSSCVCHAYVKSAVLTGLLSLLTSFGCAAEDETRSDDAPVGVLASKLAERGGPRTPPKYPWGAEDCEGGITHELRASGAKDGAYVVVGKQVEPAFTFTPPWGSEPMRAVAIHPLVANAEIVERMVLSDESGHVIAAWDRSRAIATQPGDPSLELPSGRERLKLTVSYRNDTGKEARDRSGFALCLDDIDDTELPTEDEPGHDFPKYPWGAEDCEAGITHELRASGAKDGPYVVVGKQVEPAFSFWPPWGSEPMRAVAIHPLLANVEIVERMVLSDESGHVIATWDKGRAIATQPGDLSYRLPSGRERLKLTVSYRNVTGKQAQDRSGFALCLDDIDEPEAPREPRGASEPARD